MILLIAALAVARATRLVVADSLFDRQRIWWIRSMPKFWVKLAGCPWCISGWLALAATLAVMLWAHTPLPALFWLAAWQGGNLAYWLTETFARWAEPETDTVIEDD